MPRRTPRSGQVPGGPRRHGSVRRLATAAGAFAASLAMVVAGFTTGAQTAAAAPTTGVLYSPNTTANPNEDASYPRVIRLAHSGSANGQLLATFSHSGVGSNKASFPVYRSTDGGTTWSSSPIGTVTDTVHGWDLDGPTLYELPQAEGSLPAGTLLAAGTAWNRNEYTQQAVEVFYSTDHGVTWNYRSSCTSESGMANTQGHGIWEPEFTVAGDGSLVCYFSDERPSTNRYPQVLAHVTSTDGGATWSSEVYDVAVQDGVQRPGMASVVKLPNGQYAMAYEDCKAGYDPDTACSVYVKTSPDGLNWSPVSGLGTLAQTSDGRHLLHTPQLAWSPAGGANGTLLLSGQRVVSGNDGSITVQKESGSVLFANTNLGSGSWTETTAPVVVNPTGGYDSGETSCPGYSSPILPSADGTSLLYMAGTHLGNGKCEVQFGTDVNPGATGPITGPGTTGKCVDVNTNTAGDGNAVQLWTCNGVPGQQWSIDSDHTVRSFGKCLNVVGNGTANFTKVELRTCDGSGGQQWVPQSNGSLLNPQSGRCLDDPQAQTGDGTQLQIYDCNGLFTQQWNIA
ncbi:ricin-type beta-trefoil lectin domain protein [Streptomyces sp. PTM05]|uniref:Ricin-type beta-trefoil lectin domain protein n=1 Tax=Streptantibioticus parmotrematis TaxID=2873249 RepID=A0ABS7QSC0_9ACTN|nr:sialidase family protein [Streptantibioticus parmotrematis]MBY8886086.1 ricin-type beta-trefoil lectin domain protein [Streptantibioticus parmotrematis]